MSLIPVLTTSALYPKPRYQIQLSGSTAIALNTRTWNPDYSSTTHFNVIQEAINAIASVGGTIELSDVFNLGSGAATLQIPAGVGLVGPGPLCSFNSYTPQAGMLINTTFNGPIIEFVTNPSGLVSFPYLSNVTIQGLTSLTSQVGVQVASGLLDAYMDHVLIFQCGQYGYESLGGKNWIRDCYFEDCTVAGAYLDGGYNEITSCYIFGNGIGVEVVTGTYTALLGNFFSQNSTYDLTIASAATSGVVVGNMFEQFQGGSNTPTPLHIASTNPGADWLIANNTGLNTRMGKLSVPFSTTFNSEGIMGVGGTLAAPVAPGAATVVSTTLTNNSSSGTTLALTSGLANALAAGSPFLVSDGAGHTQVFILSAASSNGATSVTITAQTVTLNTGSGYNGYALPNYKVQYTPQWVSITGGTNVYITITDLSGNVLATGLTSYTGRLEVGQWISFGGGSGWVAPTVVAAVV